MKISVIVPTGEVRIPKSGEWARNYGEWFIAGQVGIPCNIGKEHEIDVPDDAKNLRIHWERDCIHDFITSIPLPKIKKKVKKWQWAIPMSNDGNLDRFKNETFVPFGRFTEDEIREAYPFKTYYHKILETEIEVEE